MKCGPTSTQSSVMPTSVSLLVQGMLYLFCTQLNKREKGLFSFFKKMDNVIIIRKIGKLCYKTGAQPKAILAHIFKINRCQTGSVLLSFHEQDLMLDRFTKINK